MPDKSTAIRKTSAQLTSSFRFFGNFLSPNRYSPPYHSNFLWLSILEEKSIISTGSCPIFLFRTLFVELVSACISCIFYALSISQGKNVPTVNERERDEELTEPKRPIYKGGLVTADRSSSNRKWSLGRASIPRPTAYKAVALPG
jgi:hypothetical protein